MEWHSDLQTVLGEVVRVLPPRVWKEYSGLTEKSEIWTMADNEQIGKEASACDF